MKASVGIVGLGSALPEQVRGNDWWPSALVAAWDKRNPLGGRASQPDTALSPSVAAVRDAMASYADDPFKGAVTRRILRDDERPSDLEVRAAQQAMEQAGVKPGDIDTLLVYSQIPDFLMVPQSALIHQRLGLRPTANAIDTNNACNSFLQQLLFSQSLIRSGEARTCLIVQSSGAPHVCPQGDQFSAWCGDGATAAVVRQVESGFGVLASATRTDGSFYRSVVCGTPGVAWYDSTERQIAYNDDKEKAKEMLLRTAEMGCEVLNDSLAQASLKPTDVGFYASHQATPWFRPVTQRMVGLSQAAFVDTFSWTGNLSACNVPFCLALAQTHGTVPRGTIVAAYSGGSGITYTGLLMKWS